MENLVTAVSVTLPLILLMFLGMLLRTLKCIDAGFIRVANKLNYNVFLPCSVFAGTYSSRFDLSEGGNVLLTVLVSVTIMFFISILVSVLITDKKHARGTIITGMFRSNYGYVGLPVVNSILGAESCLLASMSLVVTSIVSNVYTPLGFSINNSEVKLSIKKILKDVFCNVYLIVTIIAVILMLCHCPEFPAPIHKTIASLGSVCTPLAMIALGANLNLKKIVGNRKVLNCVNLFRLVIFPLIGTFICILLGFRSESLTVLFVLYACPAATLLFTVSQEMGGDTDLASQIVAVGTVLSMVTMTIGIFVLKSFLVI